MIALTKPITANVEPMTLLPENDYRRALAAFYHAAVENDLPVALWRYPNRQALRALVDFGGRPRATTIDFTQKTPGFVFAPFVNQNVTAALFIKASLVLDPTAYQTLYRSISPDNEFEKANEARFLATYRKFAFNAGPLSQTWFTSKIPRRANAFASKAEYCRLVAEAVDYIKAVGIKKIVTSRAIETPLPPDFSPVSTFETLCERYPHAFVSLVSIPEVGTWIGASPEIFLSITPNEFQTVALAGTQALPAGVPLSQISWEAKEIEEQALVSDYIRQFFGQQNIDPVSEEGPCTVSAGNVVHLQTKFRIQLREPQLSNLANQVLHKLHPTSAVCGMPQQQALSFILEKENYDRAFYSGYLGPVHLNQESHLFVNLRCMQLNRRSAILYVGGGITKDSVPKAEWDETVLKSNTLLNVL